MAIFETWSSRDIRPAIRQVPGTPALLTSIIEGRGIHTDEERRRFFEPELSDLHDPGAIHGMDFACERIARAIRDREFILIYGDYDVDGVTSIVLLQTVLRALGADANFVVPLRLVDGYGLKMEVIERVLRERNVRLVITVDCGITSVEPVRRAIERGIDVIITDHHLPPGSLPTAAAVLNPKQDGCTYPYKELAGVGVAFKLCCELLRRASNRMSVQSLLKIAAIGTIADVAPLTGENRTIVLLGLRALADVRNPGLRVLLRTLGMYGRPPRASEVAFLIGPRINAAGRLDSADTAIRLFEAGSEQDAYPIVAELNRMNGERKSVEKAVLGEAYAMAEESGLPRILVLSGNGWHRGVLGLCASRVAQRYHRPTLMISVDGDDAVGSGRSIGGVNLHGLLESVSDHFQHFGGHDYACGFSLPTSRIESLKKELNLRAASIDERSFRRELQFDGVVTLRDLDEEFFQCHQALEPFGAGNTQPVFTARNLTVRARREFSPDCHEIQLGDGTGEISAVVWPSEKALLPILLGEQEISVAFQLEPDRYASRGYRMTVIDARPGAFTDARNESGIGAV
ncbi:MAG: single-stranded-DNA-specific exonuclease RecJ [Acidobacteriota bacterium]